MLNLSPLTPEARPIVEAAAAIYLRHFQPWFVGLVVHGSALKGGFLPGCSDIDLLLFLDRQAFLLPHGAIHRGWIAGHRRRRRLSASSP
jgi:hypothetical protein